jgi:ABC-type proline/glycine betaine transport system permease subunit
MPIIGTKNTHDFMPIIMAVENPLDMPIIMEKLRSAHICNTGYIFPLIMPITMAI